MNILSSPLWPSDMPDDRRVIAVLGMVQILEEGMSNNVSLLADLRAGKNCSHEAAAAIMQLESDVARLTQELDERARLLLESTQAGCKLTALVAMLSEALKLFVHPFQVVYNYTEGERTQIATEALAATSETVSAYENEVKAKALEEAAKLCETASIGIDIMVWHKGTKKELVEEFARKLASELRAKGE